MTLTDAELRAVLRYTDRVLVLLERDGAALLVDRDEARAVVSAACLALLDALEMRR